MVERVYEPWVERSIHGQIHIVFVFFYDGFAGVRLMTKGFKAQYRVTIGDINYGGHMGNDKALLVFQDARLHFLQSLGYSEKDIGDGRGIIMVESGVRYLREVFLHEELSVWVTVTAMKGKKFILQYEIERDTDQEPVLRGFTTFLVFDYEKRKVAVMPDGFRQKLGPYMSAQGH